MSNHAALCSGWRTEESLWWLERAKLNSPLVPSNFLFCWSSIFHIWIIGSQPVWMWKFSYHANNVEEQHCIKTRKQQTGNIFLTTQTSPKSPDLPSQILVVRHLPRLKEFWRCDPVRLVQCKSHCISPFLLSCVLSHLFQHSDNHMMSHIRPDQKATFWILQSNFLADWLLKQPTPQLTSASYSTNTGTYCEGQQSRSAHA